MQKISYVDDVSRGRLTSGLEVFLCFTIPFFFIIPTQSNTQVNDFPSGESLAGIIEEARLANFQGNIDLLYDALCRCNEAGFLRGMVEVRLVIANYYGALPDYDSAEHFLDEALELALESNDQSMLADVYDGFAEYEMNQSQYLQAYRYIDNAYLTALNADDPRMQMWALMRKGRLFGIIGDYQRSDSIARRALKIASNLGDLTPIRQIHLDLLENRTAIGDFDGALSAFKSMESLITDLSDVRNRTNFLPQSLQVKAYALNMCQMYDSALVCLEWSERLLNQIDNNEWLLVVNRIEMATSYFYLGDYKQTRFLLDLVSGKAEIFDPQLKLEALWLYYELEKALGNTDQAYRYLQEYQSLNDSESFKISEILETIKLDARTAIDRLVSEQQNLDENQQWKEKRILLILGVLGLLLILTIGIYHFYMIRNQMRLLRGKEQQIDSFRVNVHNLEQQTVVDKVKLSVNEIENLHLLDKINKLRELDLNSEPVTARKLKEVLHDIDTFGKDWSSFKRSFELIHSNFLDELKKRHSNLTENGLRHCAYVKLGLTNREVANMLGVNPATVKIARYRVNRRINPSGGTLTDYLKQIN
ncbi:MAG: hypothetical protein IPL46_14350 [Saprospiraceae bacterium]|nr:hypothetical protein [Saprospiraceae bacterium]